ncbi:MAG: DNA-protecting protein DprA [Deltaproteobacteria bacterium]|nr:DNA-protecting protein DprA [Deltaproteobacteria bacterium]
MEKILPWFALKSVHGVGNHLFKRLIDRFKSPEQVFSASYNDLLQVEGISHRLASAIQKHKIPDAVKKDLDLAFNKGFRIVTMADPDYPPLLLQIPDPPAYLYIFGNLDNSTNNIAVVGSRNATNYGIFTTKRLCRDLVALKIKVVSGMARGIDTAAHEGALLGNGKTIAVLGSGLGKVYPYENIKLFHKIAENGAVISEFPVMAKPEAHNFPLRNRIICGISQGTVVVEATRKSGSLITASLAADQGREVFAVPGSIHSFKSAGTHSLLKQGAKLVEHAHDIVEELSHVIHHSNDKNTPLNRPTNKIMDKPLSLSSDESLVFNALEPYPVYIDDIARKISMEPGKMSSILLRLELKGIVRQSPGKLFSISEKK